ncbi:hypothetical protein [Lactococcus lactis]|uniref:hypothetical protein n=1 Tax=Lactococcus lactis TaxID=1358 RepID=UPI001455F586|nr:hypothetical protein [Lactococcus lactis]MCT0439729.1 hypothetical protein [Lactococcus lactis subsp. lactis]NLS48094.1 hypothetical protein [Lactococcus lactis]
MDNKRISEIVEEEMIKQDANRYRDMRKILTIPKSIADEFDQIYEDTEEYQKNVAQMFSSMQPYFVLESYPEILHWLEDDVKNTNVVLAYLAGKALGVDLVKVGEG